MRRRLWLILAAAIATSPAAAQNPPAGEPPPAEPAPPIAESAEVGDTDDDGELSDEELAALGVDLSDETIYVREGGAKVAPGSAHTVDEEELERFEHDDVHQVLAKVPGVYIREEEGYGLRPNIGMRGSGSERSAKIALMEDGILIAPAPYSAPAAYYFPLLTRMKRLEVLKGPAAIQHGPNTVGGALNLVSKPIPRERETELDLALGQDLYAKLHGSHAESSEHFAILAEGVKLRSDGFKELDGGGDTGFDKTDLSLKARANTAVKSRVYHEVTAQVGYSDEISDETYTGLADADFAANPYRRYRATQLDRMEWNHLQLLLGHKLEIGADLSLVTKVYRNQFERTWKKLNGFRGGVDLSSVLANPMAGNNAIFYSILTGEGDSTSDSEGLILGTNAREFVSEGIQSAVHYRRATLGVHHELAAGIRLHRDEALRFHTEEGYFMTGGELLRDSTPEAVTRDSTGSALAWAGYLQDAATWGPLTLSAGARLELVSLEHLDRSDRTLDDTAFYSVLIPGGGAFYRLGDHVGLLGGIHKGYVPVAPGQGGNASPEESINVEAGARFAGSMLEAEVIGFFNDYSNLKGTCTFSSGCREDQVDEEFDGGEVHVLGLEASASARIDAGGGVSVPLRGSYTYNRSRFRTGFSSDNPQWGEVEPGFEIPYLPAHQVSVGAGVAGNGFPGHLWELSLAARHTSAMRDVAGAGDPAPGEKTQAATVLDGAASYQVGKWGRAYLTVGNMLDQTHIVSRRPFGARPGRPRLIVLGYKNTF
jgi:Fe(3+) dicitrate transport protein